MPAESIDIAFVNQYQNTMRLLLQQRDSRLEGTTIPPVKMEGEYLYWERLAATEAEALVSRHSDTPNIEPEHSAGRHRPSPTSGPPSWIGRTRAGCWWTPRGRTRKAPGWR